MQGWLLSAKYAGLVVGAIQFSIFTACHFELSRITGTLQIQYSIYNINVYSLGVRISQVENRKFISAVA